MFTIFILSGANKNSSLRRRIGLELYEYQPFIKDFILKTFCSQKSINFLTDCFDFDVNLLVKMIFLRY